MSDIKAITELAEIMASHEGEVERLKDELAEEKECVRRVAEEDLPEAMAEAGISELKLSNGRPLKLEDDCKAAITAKTHEQAMAWLQANGHGGLIKTEVVARFERGAHEEATELSDEIAQKHDEVEMKETVNAATLKAFVKEQMRDGQPIPFDIFNVHPYQKATLGKVKS